MAVAAKTEVNNWLIGHTPGLNLLMPLGALIGRATRMRACRSRDVSIRRSSNGSLLANYDC